MDDFLSIPAHMEPLPCPFCGEMPEVYVMNEEIVGVDCRTVNCPVSRIRSGPIPPLYDQIMKWNKRWDGKA